LQPPEIHFSPKSCLKMRKTKINRVINSTNHRY
jgi:hypothetical protein